MALKLVIKNGFYYATNSNNEAERNTCDVQLDTEELTATLHLKNSSGYIDYTLSLLNLSFQKKMYQPTEVVASIMIVAVDKSKWKSIDKGEVSDLFKSKQVSLYDNKGITANTEEGKVKDVIPKANEVGLDFYVQEVQTSYMSDSMIVTLKIYSLDKLLTLEKNSRTFVSKKLGTGILKDKMPTIPYNDSSTVAYSTDKMKILSYMVQDSNNNNEIREHIFPYLVQYNESFYDMLARTCNRWGEFLYYENGQLNVGYSFNDTKSTDTSEKDVISLEDTSTSKAKYAKYTYIDLDETTIGDYFNRSANYDKNIIDKPYQKSPNTMKGLFLHPIGGDFDKAIMKKFAAFFKNDKNLPTFIGNELFNDLYSLISKGITVASDNNDFNKEHFSSQKDKPEQYNEYKFKSGKADGYNPFSEISSKYVDILYKTILSNEQAASRDAVLIDFNTTFPGLKLGQVIEVNSKYYIVVQIDCKTHYQKKILDDLYVVDDTDNPVYVYQVIATPQDSSELSICYNDITNTEDDPDRDMSKETKKTPTLDTKKVKPFYPTILPTGHIRCADPQMATVDDAEDPLGNGRVRVKFSWQDSSEEASPWLLFAANASGKKGIMGKHYKDDKVFVGYVDGNVECPYVLGAVSEGAKSDIHCTTPGGHGFKLMDDEGGIMSFLTGMFSPAWGSFSDFIPGMSGLNPFKSASNNLALAGGFELSDNYGIYKISGSTDSREITIASPWGDVNLNAFTGITISAPNGDVTIKGKNVSIEAGNNLSLVSGKNVNYKLWKDKNDNMGAGALFALDIAVAVTKKLAEKFTTIVDLSIIRSVAEIVFRPVEGSLTVKSNRFLKLEAGKNECEYPAVAYNEDKKKKMLEIEAKNSILSTVGSSTNFLEAISNLSLDNGMVALIQLIPSIATTYLTNIEEKYKKASTAKKEFISAVKFTQRSSDDYVDEANPGGAVCSSYDELKAEFEKEGGFEEWKEDKLGFKPNVKILEGADIDDGMKLFKTISSKVITRLYGANGTNSISKQFEARRKAIQLRTDNRKQVLEKANALRKAICEYLEALKPKQEEVDKVYAKAYWRSMPKDFQKKVYSAVTKTTDSICNLVIKPVYHSFDDADLGLVNPNGAPILFTRRMIAYHLLQELGFTENTRKQVTKVDSSVSATGAVAGVVNASINKKTIPEPDLSSFDCAGEKSLANDDYWGDYVASLSGVPPIEKNSLTVGGALRGALTSSLNDIKDSIYGLKNMREEIAAWGEGKKGRILFATDGTTYQMENNSFNEVIGIQPNIPPFLSEDSEGLEDKQKKKLAAFVATLRTELGKI